MTAKNLEAELREILKEQENLKASERLAGNIVKEEFHKGAIFGINLVSLLTGKLVVPNDIERIAIEALEWIRTHSSQLEQSPEGLKASNALAQIYRIQRAAQTKRG